MKFNYKHYGHIPRPVIPITLKGQSASFRYEALIDSGADICLFDEEMGTYLGLNVRSGKAYEVFGIGGKASIYYIHPITIEVGGWPYMIDVGFMEAVAGKTKPFGILGQRCFFDKFVVIFDLSKEEIELKQKSLSTR